MARTRSPYTLQEAQELLNLWKDCERELASGQAKSYRIGTREYTAFDLDAITRKIQHYASWVDALSNPDARTNRVASFVPRDL